MSPDADMYREWEPPVPWGDVVACRWAQHVAVDRVQRVLPDGHADLLIYDRETIEVVGVYDEVALPALPAGTRIRGIRLRPEAVAAAFRTTAGSLRNATVPADAVLGSRLARQLLDERFVDRWLRSIEPDPRASIAVSLLQSHSVPAVARQVGMSERQLRRTMLDEVGVTPKAYQRVMRMRRFLRHAEAGARLAAAAADAGYADQSHLTREVRQLSGLTPARLVAERLTASRSAEAP